MEQSNIDEVIGDKRAVMTRTGEMENFTVFEEERPISILRLLPYSIAIKKKQTSVTGEGFGFSFANIKKESATCVSEMMTRPDKGHLGLSDEVMYEALKQQREQGRALTYYNPENLQELAQYRQFGFAPVSDSILYVRDRTRLTDSVLQNCMKEGTCSLMDTACDIKILEASEIPSLVEFVNTELGVRYSIFTVRTVAYFERLVDALAEYHGYIFLIKKQERIVGYFAMEDVCHNEICREAFFTKDELRDAFFEIQKDTLPVLARIVSLRKLVKHICSDSDVTIALRIEDPMLRMNNGTYLWFLNRNGSRLELIQTGNTSLPGPELSVTIGELTSILLGYKSVNNRKFESIKLLGPIWLPERD